MEDGHNDSVVLCRECRTPVQPGSRFCGACGQRVETGLPENERRQLTLLFSDIVGSTELSERLDAEDWNDLLSSYHQVCRDVIARYQGHVSQFLGDGVMAYFGYPIAHEDDAVRAVHAAREIVESTRPINEGIGKRLGAELHVRVGLHTGVAVVGEVGPGGARDMLAVGETVNLAARIQSFAAADTVVVSALTARLIDGHFDLEPLGEQSLKGFKRPFGLFGVGPPTGARSKFEAAARGVLTPYVGRADDLDTLTAAWREVRQGADRVVVVRGEAGIGKSRLLHHFRSTALREGARVVECFCSPLAQATAFAPMSEMLAGRVTDRAAGESLPQARLKALASMLADHSRFGADALPLIAALLSIPGADERTIQDLSPVRRRTRTLELLREWISSSAERLPFVLLIEDLHWADPSTLDFLDLIVREKPGGRTLLCVTGRPELSVRWESDHLRTIELEQLNPDEVAAVVTHVAGGRAVPDLVTKIIAERSEGVPLYVEELAKQILGSTGLREEADRYELVGPLDDRPLPSTLEGLLTTRFNNRQGEIRNVAQVAAAIGREFTYPLIRAVTGLSDAALRQHLDDLCQNELAFVGGEPPHAVYRFKHALIQDAIYGTLVKENRTDRHERIFQALRDGFPELVASRPEMVAHHAEQAKRREAAIPLLRDAGLNALGRGAVNEAVKHLAHGIELVGVLQEPERTALEAELQAALGPAYMATVGWAAPEVERSSARLRDLAAALGDGPKLFQAVWSLWSVDFLRGQLEPALEIARQAFGMAEAVGDSMLRLMGHHAVGYTHFYRGEYDEALRHVAEAEELFDLEREKRIASLFQLSSTVALRCYRTEALQVLGRPQEAAESLADWRLLLDELGHAPSLAYSLCMQCFFFHAQGNFEQVRRLATEARALSITEGFAFWIPIAETFLAWANAHEGRNAAESVNKMRLAKARINHSLTHITEVELTSMCAETLLLAGQPHEVFPLIEGALEIATNGPLRHYVPEMYRLQGEAARVIGDWNRAVAFYNRAIESAQQTGVKGLEQRAIAALGQGPYPGSGKVNGGPHKAGSQPGGRNV